MLTYAILPNFRQSKMYIKRSTPETLHVTENSLTPTSSKAFLTTLHHVNTVNSLLSNWLKILM